MFSYGCFLWFLLKAREDFPIRFIPAEWIWIETSSQDSDFSLVPWLHTVIYLYLPFCQRSRCLYFFLLLYLLYPCDKFSCVCLSFDEWVLKVSCLKVKQQSSLKMSCLKYNFVILLFCCSFALSDLTKEPNVYVNS